MERPCAKHHWSLLEKLANPLFFFDMSLGHSLLSRVSNSKPLRNSGLFCYLPLCREVRKILLIPIGYGKA